MVRVAWCVRCGHVWKYRGKKKYAYCNNCKTHTSVFLIEKGVFNKNIWIGRCPKCHNPFLSKAKYYKTKCPYCEKQRLVVDFRAYLRNSWERDKEQIKERWEKRNPKMLWETLNEQFHLRF